MLSGEIIIGEQKEALNILGAVQMGRLYRQLENYPRVAQICPADNRVQPMYRCADQVDATQFGEGKTVVDFQRIKAGDRVTLVASTAILTHDYVTCASNGRVQPVSNATPALTWVLGRAVEAAGANGRPLLVDIIMQEQIC
jgi:hypothetical protein